VAQRTGISAPDTARSSAQFCSYRSARQHRSAATLRRDGPQLLHHSHDVDVMTHLVNLVALESEPDNGWRHHPPARGWQGRAWGFKGAGLRAFPEHLLHNRVPTADTVANRPFGVRKSLLPILEDQRWHGSGSKAMAVWRDGKRCASDVVTNDAESWSVNSSTEKDICRFVPIVFATLDWRIFLRGYRDRETDARKRYCPNPLRIMGSCRSTVERLPPSVGG
jgi:hypothetical protein